MRLKLEDFGWAAPLDRKRWELFLSKGGGDYAHITTVLQTRIRDPVPLDPWIRDDKKIRIRDRLPEQYFRVLKKLFLGLQYSNSFMRIRGGKIRIRDIISDLQHCITSMWMKIRMFRMWRRRTERHCGLCQKNVKIRIQESIPLRLRILTGLHHHREFLQLKFTLWK